MSGSPSRAGDLTPASLGDVHKLGRYEILTRIASGGMASVYLARTTGAAGFERLFAIKHCHPHLMDDAEFRGMFLDEARLAARIHHPNVVSTLDVSDEDGLYLVMEYIEGGRVSDIVRATFDAGPPIPVEIAVRIIIDALTGLHAAHETHGPRGEPLAIVHRDVSPQNLLVGVDGVTRVVDFGIAKAEARATVTSDHQMKGKLGYMAPEQLQMKPVSARTDVFAAGVVAWELLTGQRLFRGDSREDTIQRVLHLPLPTIGKRRPDVPEAVGAAVQKALSRNPEERFSTALAFADALEAAVDRVASHRVVGAFVADVLREPLVERRELLQRTGTQAAAGAALPDAVPTGVASGVMPTGARRKRRGLAMWIALAVLLGIAFGVAAWWMVDTPPATEVATPPTGPTEAPAPVTDPAPAPVADPAPTPAPAATETAPDPEAAPRERRRPRRRRPRMRETPSEFRPNTI